MKFDEIQRGWPEDEVVTTGKMALIENMRPACDGSHVAVRGPKAAGRIREGYMAVCHDRRDDMYNIISFNGAELAFEGSIDSDGEYDFRGEHICSLAEEPAEYGAAGEYLVIKMADGQLKFMLWEADLHEYTWLGNLPELPEVRISVCEEAGYEAILNGVSFKNVVADLREGIPEEISRQVSRAVRGRIEEATAELRKAGKWVQPVMARIGYRLWDGTLYALSDAIRIDGMKGYFGGERVTLDVIRTGDGFTGTAESVVTVPAYSLKVEYPGLGSGEWSRVIRYIEIYVSEEQEPLDSEDGKVTYSSSSGKIGVILPMRDIGALEGELPHQRVIMTLRETADRGIAGKLTNAASIRSAEMVTGIDAPSKRADHICGHGGYLHLSRGGEVITMARNNPLRASGRTQTGSKVEHIAAQPTGGGAYTRQYIYIFSESGISALLHDMAGEHRNCRPISSMTRGGGCVACEEGLAIITGEGCLAMLRDSKVRVLMRGLSRNCGIAWHRGRNELWIEGGERGTLVICLNAHPAELRGYMLSHTGLGRYERILTPEGEVTAIGRDGEILSYFGYESNESPTGEATWMTAWMALPHTNYGRLCTDIRCSDKGWYVAEVWGRYGQNDEEYMMGDMRVVGPVKSNRYMGLAYPAMKYADSKGRILLRGHIDAVYGCKLE